MAMKATIQGRSSLTAKLAELAPAAERYAAKAKIEIAEDAARQIASRAPKNTGDYAASIKADVVANRPKQEQVGVTPSKDPDATGVYASFIWRFLEFGTAPHNVSKGGGNKSFKGNAKMHPGTPAMPHIFPTWRSMKVKAMRKLRMAVNKGVREAMNK